MIGYTPVVVARKTETFLQLLTRKQVIRSRDLDRAGIPRNYLNRLVERGQLRKIERGLYGVPELKASEHMTLVEVAARIRSRPVSRWAREGNAAQARASG